MILYELVFWVRNTDLDEAGDQSPFDDPITPVPEDEARVSTQGANKLQSSTLFYSVFHLVL